MYRKKSRKELYEEKKHINKELEEYRVFLIKDEQMISKSHLWDYYDHLHYLSNKNKIDMIEYEIEDRKEIYKYLYKKLPFELILKIANYVDIIVDPRAVEEII